MRIPITREFNLFNIVGWIELDDDFTEEVVELAKEGLTFRLDTCLSQVGDQTTLVGVSVSSPFPSVLSDTLMMKPLFLSREDEEDAYDEFIEEDDDDEEVVLPVHPPLKSQAYDSALLAIAQGHQNRALLLKEGYVFDARHHFEDVQPYEFAGGEYRIGGLPVQLLIQENGAFSLDSITFENIEGKIRGCVVYNEKGLMVHIPLDLEARGGKVTIQAPPR